MLAKLSKSSFVFALFIISSFSTELKARGFPAPSVNVVEAQERTLSPVAWVSGTVVSRNNSQIAADVSGRIVSLAEIGARVSKGDLLAKIDDSTLKIQLMEDQANVENAQSRLAFLESEVKRKTSLAERNLSAKTDLDQTLSQRDVAKGDLAAATARLAKTKQQLAFTELKAPFEGLVTQRLRSQGEYVTSGTAIIHLVETKNLEVSLYAPITAYRFLSSASELRVQSALGEASAPIKSIVPVAEDRSHLMQVRLDMSDIDWPVGLSIKAAVASGESKLVLAVPRDAIVLRREGMSIFKVNAENQAQQVPVEIGLGVGEFIEIKGNVNAGDKVIIRGAERLQPGQTVQIKENNSQLISGNKQ
ncbi:efflux RND transporter periplasmic adaptor subunit [Aliikangiella sp. IMCC44632]